VSALSFRNEHRFVTRGVSCPKPSVSSRKTKSIAEVCGATRGGDPAACAPLGGKSPRENTPLGDEAPLPRDYIEVREKREAQQSKGELPGPDEAISGRSHSRDAKGERITGQQAVEPPVWGQQQKTQVKQVKRLRRLWGLLTTEEVFHEDGTTARDEVRRAIRS
jgi:hypothetical protein